MDEGGDINVAQAVDELNSILTRLADEQGKKDGFALMDGLVKVFKRSERARYELDVQRYIDA
jgi:hypothetical protein